MTQLTEIDAELQGSLAALRRAAQRAREIARQTGTYLVVVREGRLMRVSPEGGILDQEVAPRQRLPGMPRP